MRASDVQREIDRMAMSRTANEALERMAENARELGLDYEPDEGALTKDQIDQIRGEPVAWRNAAIRVGEDLCSVGPFGYYDMTAEQWLDWALSVVTVHAPPAQRTWVGLTDNHWNRSKHNYDFQKGVDWAESILKEKNG